MQQDTSANNKRIAKNTLVLYVRMLFLMAINLYASRVILQALGVEDYGIYNVVGGFVALFAILSQSLSSAASRFLTYEMGRGDVNRLSQVFSATLIIHVILAIIIVLLSEVVGVWFVNEKMVMDSDRVDAANWIFQFSILTFCINLITVPHNASIIAHEKMSTFAYISVFEGIGMLLICYFVMFATLDRLVIYGFLVLVVRGTCRYMFYFYSKRNFPECRMQFVYNKQLMKEIFGFASWNMIGSSASILRNQGGNILLNLFAGPTVNAARAIANQVLHAVNSFVQNFFMALRPQITKSYAKGDYDYMMTLIFQGSRLSYYMLLVICLPVFLNTDILLHIWLKNVPAHTVLFVQLTLIFALVESISAPLITAQLATGKVRKYQLIVGGFQMLNLPVSYLALKMGGIPESVLCVAIFFSICSLFARLYMLRINVCLNVRDFVYKVMANIFIVSSISIVIPYYLHVSMDETFLSFILNTIVCILCSLTTILFVGCNKMERKWIYAKITKFFNKK